MDNALVLAFLEELRQNNSLDWMHANKARYQQAKEGFEDFLQQLIFRIARFDASVAQLQPRELVFRLNRDTRFAKDKSPYNPAFRAHISPGGRTPFPAGYYLCIKPGASFLGGGVFATQFPEATRLVRDHIAAHPEGLEAILHSEAFREHFEVSGEKLKNVPAGYDKAHPLAEYLKHKSWDIEVPLSDGQFLAPDVLEHCAETFRMMKPLNDYLNEAVGDFELPKRP